MSIRQIKKMSKKWKTIYLFIFSLFATLVVLNKSINAFNVQTIKNINSYELARVYTDTLLHIHLIFALEGFSCRSINSQLLSVAKKILRRDDAVILFGIRWYLKNLRTKLLHSSHRRHNDKNIWILDEIENLEKKLGWSDSLLIARIRVLISCFAFYEDSSHLLLRASLLRQFLIVGC